MKKICSQIAMLSILLLSVASSGAAVLSKSFDVALLPNEPFQKGFQKSITVDSINQQNVQLTLFNGDTKDGGSRCEDNIIGEGLVSYLNRLDSPTLYSLGDNEWTDCHRISNGNYDPLERLSLLRKIFFSKATTQGVQPMPVKRQGALGEKFSENSRLIYNEIMFIALHVVGSNNNLVATEKQCKKKSNRAQKDCDAATTEYIERNRRNIEWLKDSFKIARDENLAGVALLIQADIYFPFELSDGGYDDFLKSLDEKNGFTDFFNTLVDETHNFKGQVVLIHGDSHYFKVDKAMFEKNGTLTPNFTRVQTFGSNETSWVKMHVNPQSNNVFSFQPVILPNVKELQNK